MVDESCDYFFDFGGNPSENNNILWKNVYYTNIPINYLYKAHQIIKIQGSNFTVIKDRFSSDVPHGDLQEQQKNDIIIKIMSATIK